MRSSCLPLRIYGAETQKKARTIVELAWDMAFPFGAELGFETGKYGSAVPFGTGARFPWHCWRENLRQPRLALVKVSAIQSSVKKRCPSGLGEGGGPRQIDRYSVLKKRFATIRNASCRTAGPGGPVRPGGATRTSTIQRVRVLDRTDSTARNPKGQRSLGPNLCSDKINQSGRCQGTLTIMMRCLPERIRRIAIISGRWLCKK